MDISIPLKNHLLKLQEGNVKTLLAVDLDAGLPELSLGLLQYGTFGQSFFLCVSQILVDRVNIDVEEITIRDRTTDSGNFVIKCVFVSYKDDSPFNVIVTANDLVTISYFELHGERENFTFSFSEDHLLEVQKFLRWKYTTLVLELQFVG